MRQEDCVYIRRGSSNDIEIKLDEPISGMWYRVTLLQELGGEQPKKLTKDQDHEDCSLSADGRTLTVHLTQRDTLGFVANRRLEVQVRYGSGSAACSFGIASNVMVLKTLDEEEVRG